MKKLFAVLPGFIFGLLCLLAATAIALALIHLTDFPYRMDIDLLHLEDASGMDRSAILSNYHAVMSFLSPFSTAPFHLPSIAYSPGGAQHFDDCKVLFNAVYLAGGISLALLPALLFFTRKSPRHLQISGITTLAVPCLLFTLIAINFNQVFLWFHSVFFNNDLWIFDPKKDAVITILPSAFFMHCAIFIAVFWVASALLQLFAHRRLQKNAVRSPGNLSAQIL